MKKVVLSAKIKKCEIVEGKLEFDKLQLTSLFGEDTEGKSQEDAAWTLTEGEDGKRDEKKHWTGTELPDVSKRLEWRYKSQNVLLRCSEPLDKNV